MKKRIAPRLKWNSLGPFKWDEKRYSAIQVAHILAAVLSPGRAIKLVADLEHAKEFHLNGPLNREEIQLASLIADRLDVIKEPQPRPKDRA